MKSMTLYGNLRSNLKEKKTKQTTRKHLTTIMSNVFHQDDAQSIKISLTW